MEVGRVIKNGETNVVHVDNLFIEACDLTAKNGLLPVSALVTPGGSKTVKLLGFNLLIQFLSMTERLWVWNRKYSQLKSEVQEPSDAETNGVVCNKSFRQMSTTIVIFLYRHLVRTKIQLQTS